MLKVKWDKILSLLITTYIISCENVGFFQCFLKGFIKITKFSLLSVFWMILLWCYIL